MPAALQLPALARCAALLQLCAVKDNYSKIAVAPLLLRASRTALQVHQLCGTGPVLHVYTSYDVLCFA